MSYGKKFFINRGHNPERNEEFTTPVNIVSSLVRKFRNLNEQKKSAINKFRKRRDYTDRRIRDSIIRRNHLSAKLENTRLRLLQTRSQLLRTKSFLEMLEGCENFAHEARALPLVNEMYRITERIGEGSTSYVCQATDVVLGHVVVVKIQKGKLSLAHLTAEESVYRQLNTISPRSQHRARYPQVYYVGRFEMQNVMVMDRLGPSLSCVQKSHLDGIPMRDIINVGIQLILRLKDLHGLGIVHCNITPSNIIAMSPAFRGWGIIDFSNSRLYLEKNRHVPFLYRFASWRVGCYSSVHAHIGCTPCRRDDLESLAYVLLHLLEGTLPWLHLDALTPEHSNLWISMKSRILETEMMRKAPRAFYKFVEVIMTMEPTSEPPYESLIGFLKEMGQEYVRGHEGTNELVLALEQGLTF